MAALAELRAQRLAADKLRREDVAARYSDRAARRNRKAARTRKTRLRVEGRAENARQKREAAERYDIARQAQRHDLDAAGAIVPRAVALGIGLLVYRTGVECKNGHTTCRVVTNGRCLDCDR